MNGFKRWSVVMALLCLNLSACQKPADIQQTNPPASLPITTAPATKSATQIALSDGLVIARPYVLVEKSTRRLTLYDGQTVVKVYRVCTGLVVGDKQREGDKMTPVGLFYICYKNPQSKYTLSLGLSYPNIEDADRGQAAGLITQQQHDAICQAINAGTQPPWDTPLGGEIMIHGAGAGRPGSAGCVGMDDDDIRELYPLLPIGTAVEILP
jgi:murein L,D-transpeptidase YafK